jgi:hypothetical protein
MIASMMSFISILTIFASQALAGGQIRLKLGEILKSQEHQLEVHLKKFHTTKTECAVPGFNCGSGYTPEPVTTPVLSILLTNPECKKSPLPKNCEWTYRILGSDNKSYVDIEFLNIYDFCMRESNKSNRNSCILRTTVGNHFNPMYSPENCSRADDLVVKNNCYEMMAEQLNDPKLCENVARPYGHRCVFLMAKSTGNPEICQQIKSSPLNASEENGRGLFLNRCLEMMNKLNLKK